jgi:hypothetical protein
MRCAYHSGVILAQIAETAPWWGVPVLAGGFAVGGIVLSQLVSVALEWRRNKRRHEADIRSAVVRILNIGLPLRGPHVPLQLHELADATTELQVIASRRVAQAARDHFWAIAQERAPEVFKPEIKRYPSSLDARNALMNEVRKALGNKRLPDDVIL